MSETITDDKLERYDASMHHEPEAAAAAARAAIRQLMTRAGIVSERDLALRCGIDQSALNRFMRGEADWLRVPTVQKLADFFGVTSAHVLGEVPISRDARIDAVLTAMQQLPSYALDAVLATSRALLNSSLKEDPRH